MFNKKKAGCILAASILSVSMSLGVFASSPTDPEIPEYDYQEEPEVTEGSPIEKVTANTVDKDGYGCSAHLVYKEASEKVQEFLADENNVRNVLADAGYTVTEDMDILMLGMGELEYYGPGYEFNEEEQELPEGGLDVVIDFVAYHVDTKDLEAGDIIYVLHQKSDGSWEVLEGKVYDYGGSPFKKAKVHFDSLSPVAFIKVMSNGEAVVLDKDNNKIGNLNPEEVKGQGQEKESADGSAEKTSGTVVKTTAEKKSPKTGN